MSRQVQDSRTQRERLNEELVEVVRHLGTLGPRRINEVARLARQHRESVRYRYHRFLVRNGISMQGTPNFSRLGFTRLVIIAKLRPDLEGRATAIFTLMSEICYLRSFTRTLLEHEYIIHVAVPKLIVHECERVFEKFRDMNLFTDLRILEFEETRNPPMMAEFYNFLTEKWSFSWQRSSVKEQNSIQVRREDVQKYDKFDLLILKELEIDAGRNLRQVSEKIGAPLKLLQFHYLNHVTARNLVSAYRVIWPGSRYDFEEERPVTRKDRYIEINILLEGGTNSENAELRALVNKIPFLWFEAVEPHYLAELYVPNDSYIEFFEYLDSFAGRVKKKLKVYTMDQAGSIRYTIPYKLFDPETKQWRLDRDGVLKAVGQLANCNAALGT